MEELRMSNDSGGRLATAHWKLLLQGSRCDTAKAAQSAIAYRLQLCRAADVTHLAA
jgi:hypothetical protein